MNGSQYWINHLQLAPHDEGGYFRRTFQADQRAKLETPLGPRYSVTSIYYLLSADRPLGYFHRNQSDIVHCFHAGQPVTYYLLHEDGQLETQILGPDVEQGHQLQLVVSGGIWKAAELEGAREESYGLLTEVVVPGFDYDDRELGHVEQLVEQFPEQEAIIHRLTPQ